jgi:hypothetical protein
VKLTPEEKEQINKATHYSMGDTMSSRIFPLIDEVLRKRGERIEALEKKCGLYMRGLEAEEKDCEALEAEKAALRQRVEALTNERNVAFEVLTRIGTAESIHEATSAILAARNEAGRG